MKKLLLWIFAILVISACVQKKNEERTLLGFGTQYTLFPEYLNGKVKEMRETNYWAVEQDGKFIKGNPITWKELDSIGSTKNAIVYFDEQGNFVKQDNFDENNITKNSLKVSYENGRSVRWEYSRADTCFNYYIPEYDTDGFLKGGKLYRCGADTLIASNVLTHDAKGNYTKVENMNFRNNKGGSEELVFNDDGRITEVRFINSKDTLDQSFLNEYDEKGFMTGQKVMDGKSNMKSSWKISALKYDEHGNCTQILSDVDNGKFRLIAERSYIYY